MSSETTIDVRVAAKSKTFRMLSVYKMRDLVQRALEGRVARMYRKGETNEYHIIYDRYAVVVKMEMQGEEETAVVITQMHTHPDYRDDETYERVDSLQYVAGYN